MGEARTTHTHTPAPRSQICDEQAGELRRAEEQLASMEGALLGRNQQVAALTSKVAELEAEVESTRHEQRTFGSVFAAKERDQVRKLEGLQDEVRRRPAAAGWGVCAWRGCCAAACLLK